MDPDRAVGRPYRVAVCVLGDTVGALETLAFLQAHAVNASDFVVLVASCEAGEAVSRSRPPRPAVFVRRLRSGRIGWVHMSAPASFLARKAAGLAGWAAPRTMAGLETALENGQIALLICGLRAALERLASRMLSDLPVLRLELHDIPGPSRA